MEENYLQYGDIIHITSHGNNTLNNKTFFINYIDNKFIRIVNPEANYTINIEDDRTFSDKTITYVEKLSSSSVKGFALQNKLIPGKRIVIKLSVDFPDITGIITNLENDRIEITDDNKDIIYIDFEYKGIPPFINKITVKSVPVSDEHIDIPQLDNIDIDDEIKHIHDKLDINNELKTMYLNSNDFIFNDNMVVHNKRYLKHSIEDQITDIVNTLLSTIPNHQRTEGVFSEVHHIVQRYTQLRNMFSKKDKHGTILCPSLNGKNTKPIATLLNPEFTSSNNSKIPKWLLPVISTQRKLYTTPQTYEHESVLGQENVQFDNIANALILENELQRKYYRNTNTKYGYAEHINDYNNFMTPYVNNTDDVSNQYICNDQETIIFDAMTWSKNNIWSKTDYLIQKIHDGKINVTSILMLPDVMVEFSKMSLSNSTIMTRSSMNRSYVSLFKILENFSEKNIKIVDVFEEINYNANKTGQNNDSMIFRENQNGREVRRKRKEQKFNFTDFLHSTTNFVMDRNNSEDNEKYAKFLYTIIPSTRDLLKLFSNNKHMSKNYSFLEFVDRFMEPHMIYSKNIHFEEGYEFIQYAVKTAIEEYKKKIIVDSKKSRRKILHLKQKNVLVYNQNQIEEIVKGNQQLYDKCYTNNSLEVITQSSSTEQIANALKVDGAYVMANIIFSKNQHLVVNPSFVDDVLDTVKSTDDKCSQNFITKKYTSQSELEQDNGVEILYYDVGFDHTPYEILEMYKEERSRDNFDAFLRKQLIEKHSCPINASAELADTLIRGKKQIVNDEYAVLIVDNTQNFFQRKLATNKWVIDKTVKPEIFINNNDLFKNINNKKNKTANSSDTITVHRNMYVAEFKSRLDELDNRLTVENSIIAQNLSGFITRNNNLTYIQSHEQNIF